MYGILKHAHLTLILIAVVIFILSFYWMESGHKNAQKPIFKKILLHTHLTIILLGLALMGVLQLNPFASENFWLLEKLVALVGYLILVKVALHEKTRKGMQFLAFAGALGWIFYIGQLAFSKQAIILLG
ncbi:MAG TPA: SirB2 family protein [Psychromonas sp.]